MDYIIYFIITIGILVFIHEFGHFAAAKLCGMRADVFAIGFGKRLFGWNKKTGFSLGELPKDFDGEGHTDYRVSLLPLGGYVKIAGMVDESFDTDFADEEPKPYEFRAKPTYQKLIVISAGVIMNLLLAILVFWGANYFQPKAVTKTTTIGYVEPHSAADSLGFRTDDKIIAINGDTAQSWEDVVNDIYLQTAGQNLTFNILRNGQDRTIDVSRKAVPSLESADPFLLPSGVRPRIDEVLPKSPASKAGIKAGDIFLSLNNVPLFSSKQATEIIKAHKGKEMPLIVLRGKDTLNLAVAPGTDGMIGVGIGDSFTGPVDYVKSGFFESFSEGWDRIINYTVLTGKMVGQVISGNVAFGKVFMGPIRIAKYSAISASGGFLDFLSFLAILSLSLAIFNILPFPVLDGGHFAIIIIEALIKREIPIKVKVAIQNAGFVILLLLMAFIIYNDIINL
jgi:regulator of sigma E protease